MTERLQVDVDRPDPAAIERAAAILRSGGLVAFPTETVYGLGAHALNRAAVRRIFEAKERPPDDPLIVHVHRLGQLTALAEQIPEAASRLAAQFWPGPLTIVLRRAPVVPDEVTAGLDTVAIRMPAHPIARALIEAADIPVAAPSANLFSRPSPTRAEHVLQDLDGRIDLLIDGGPTTVGVESTVLDLTAPAPTILRPGAVTLEMVRRLLPDARMRQVESGESSGALASPGLLSRHYSPRALLTLYEGSRAATLDRIARDATDAVARGQRVGIIVADDDHIAIVADADFVRIVRLGGEDDLATVASNLYNALRTLDAAGVDVIIARSFPEGSGLGVAIHDRLRRAAASRVVRVEN